MLSGSAPSWDHGGKSRQARGYGAAWDRVRKAVMQRDKGLCQPCLERDRLTPAHAVDHILAKANGGTDNPDNLRAICRACHLDKTMRDCGRRRKQQTGADGWPIEDPGR
jgi:5-methylcytosine-specific restriction protein A